MKLNSSTIALISLIAAGTGVGCSDDDDGTLQQNWTIAGQTSSTLCAQTRATQMRLILIDPGGGVRATEFASCDAFGVSVSLEEDNYTGTATFLDNSGVPVSETLGIPLFGIRKDQTTTLRIDFPLTAFIAR